MPSRSIIALMLISTLLISAGALLAEGEEPGGLEPWRRFEVNVGGFFNGVDSSVMLGAPGIGLSLDVEELLGLDTRTTVFHASGFWRYTGNRRHKLELSWFAVRRGAEHVIGRNIEIGDTLYLEGTSLEASLDIDIFKAGYSYSFFQDDRVDLSVSAGLFVMPMSFEVSATRETTRSARTANITAPLPVFGLRTDTALTPHWSLCSGFQLFYIEIGNFRGAITDLAGAIEYKPYTNLGFGLGFESFNLRVEAQGGDYPGVDFEGSLDFRYVGALLYVKGMW